MIKLLFSSIVIFFLMVVSIRSIYASLIINEIYPAPATGDYEWVELYNSGTDSADLTQYLLSDLANNKIKINESTLAANNYLIASCSSVLNNSGDTVFLKKLNGEIVHIATYSGSFTSDKSYAKCQNNIWLITDLITKNFSNEAVCFLPEPTIEATDSAQIKPTSTPIPTSIPTLLSSIPSPKPCSYDNIYLSEVYPYPESSENEWIEIFNNNDFQVELTNWYFDDIENAGSSPKTFSITLDAKNYAVIDLSSSMFNNSGDSVRLMDFDKLQKDSFEYTDSEKEKSWGRVDFDSDEFCQQNPSKNYPNNSCLHPSLVSSTIQKPLLIPTKIVVTKTFITQPKSLMINKSTTRTAPTSSPQILGTTDISPRISPSKNNQQPLSKTLSFIAFSNSLLTIGSVLLKIKFHEALKLLG